MFEFLIKLNFFWIVFVTSIFTVALGLYIHIYSRRIFRQYITGDDKKIGTMLFGVNASVLSLLFSITLFQIRSEFAHISKSSGEEISQIEDIRRSSAMLNEKDKNIVLNNLQDYLDYMIKNEFDVHINHLIIQESNNNFDKLRSSILKISPSTYHEKLFRNQMIKTMEDMVDNRGVRLYRKESSVNTLYYILLFVFLVSLIFLISFERTKISTAFVVTYSILTSVLLSITFATSTYFIGEETNNYKFYKDALIDVQLNMEQSEIKDDDQIKTPIPSSEILKDSQFNTNSILQEEEKDSLPIIIEERQSR